MTERTPKGTFHVPIPPLLDLYKIRPSSGSSLNSIDFCLPLSEILVIVVPFCSASGMTISDTMGLSASGVDLLGVGFWGIASLRISADILARRFVSFLTHSLAPCWEGMIANTGEAYIALRLIVARWQPRVRRHRPLQDVPILQIVSLVLGVR